MKSKIKETEKLTESDDEIINEDVWNFIQTHKNDKKDDFEEWLFNQSFKPTDKIIKVIVEYNTCEDEIQHVTKIVGQLEIDVNRGVIWFNSNEGICRMRVSNLSDTEVNDLMKGLLDIRMSKPSRRI